MGLTPAQKKALITAITVIAGVLGYSVVQNEPDETAVDENVQVEQPMQDGQDKL